MKSPQRILLVGGLLIIVVGLVYGAAYNWLVGYDTLTTLRESYGAAVWAAASGDEATFGQALARGKQMNYRYVRVVDVHTHLIKVASLVLLLGLLYPLIPDPSKAVVRWVLVLVVGTVLFPLGVFLEIVTSSILAQAVAALGALMVITAFAALFLNISRGLPSETRA